MGLANDSPHSSALSQGAIRGRRPRAPRGRGEANTPGHRALLPVPGETGKGGEAMPAERGRWVLKTLLVFSTSTDGPLEASIHSRAPAFRGDNWTRYSFRYWSSMATFASSICSTKVAYSAIRMPSNAKSLGRTPKYSSDGPQT